MSDKPQAGALDGLDALDLSSRSNTVFDPGPDGPAKTVVDPTALRTTGRAAANDPRRALSPKPAAATLALPAGFRLFEYRIDRVLGQGGFGIAYAATDVNLAAKVVIKEYLPEDFAYRASDQTVSARADQDQPYY